MKSITPCLWLGGNSEEAVGFYTSIFKNSRIGKITRYGEAGFEYHGKPAGTAMIVEFELDGHEFTALNGSPMFTFNEAISFQVNCDTQEEVDYYWERLSEGGDEAAQQCGWLKDKYGVSWQILPTVVCEMLQTEDPRKSESIMQALHGMKKLDIGVLKQAYDRE